MPGGSFFSFTASLQYRADRVPSSCQERPLISNAPSWSRAIRSRLTAEGSFGPRSVRENCHQIPSMRTRRPSFSIALRSFSLMTLICAAVAASSYRTQVRPRRSLGSFACLAWSMKVRCTEKAGFKHDIVSRRGLTGFRFRRCAWARGRPVVPREHERGEIDFMRKLDEARERDGPRSEGRRPGIDMANILKAARQRRAVRRLIETGTAAVEHQGHKTAVIGSVTQP